MAILYNQSNGLILSNPHLLVINLALAGLHGAWYRIKGSTTWCLAARDSKGSAKGITCMVTSLTDIIMHGQEGIMYVGQI